MPQSNELFVGLKRLDKTAQYVQYEGEGHGEGEWRYENQVDYFERTLNWFNKYLKPESLDQNKAP